MKKLLLTLAASALLLGRCTPAAMPDMTPDTKKTAVSADEENGYVPLNFQYQKGVWLPYTEYESLVRGKSEKEFRQAVGERFRKAADEGLNTVYLHVRPDGTAYYNSSLFPKSPLINGDYDPLQVMLEEAHSLGLSAHAWINPLRLQTAAEMERVPD
ncbi:MAG: family 10 glycosylhydrolase, partial [Ruminococcus sp.]|nr:family 10 glycosylhydrolase [Ruminococcus sp.]